VRLRPLSLRGTGNINGCEVWRYDGSAWTQVVGQDPPGTSGTGPGFGDRNKQHCTVHAGLRFPPLRGDLELHSRGKWVRDLGL